jgi:PAS domain S-box-containing protein
MATSLPHMIALLDAFGWKCVAGAVVLIGAAAVFCSLLSRARLRRALERHCRDEARLRATIGQLPAIVWTTDASLRFTSSDGAGLAPLGLRPGQLVGMTLAESLGRSDPSDPPLVSHGEALQGKSCAYEWSSQGRTFAVHCEPLRDAAGQVVGVVGVALDITPRKRAEDALARSEARNRALLTAIPDVMFRLTRDGKLLEFIDKFVAPNPHYVGSDVRHVFPANVARQFLDASAAAVSSGQTQAFEYQTTIRNRPRYFEARVVACSWNEVLAIVRNVTERRVAEDELRRREGQLRSIIRTIPDLMFQFTRDGRLAGCIAQNPDDLLMPVDQFLGRSIAEVLPPPVAETVMKHLHLAAETGQTQVVQYPLEMPGGDQRWFEARLVAAEDGSELVMALVRNITEQMKGPSEIGQLRVG